jgi:hypothetical protein
MRSPDLLSAALAAAGPARFLLYFDAANGKAFAEYFHDYDDMATRAARLVRRRSVYAQKLKAFDRDGSRLGARELLARGDSICDAEPQFPYFCWSARNVAGYERRNGPVPGTACHRGGRGYMRRIGTIPEKIQAQRICPDEPAPRGRRSASNIPDSWDDFMRHNDHCWKTQRAGSKSWDRKENERTSNRKALLEIHRLPEESSPDSELFDEQADLEYPQHP